MRAISLFLHSTGTGPFIWDHVAPEVHAGTDKLAPTHLGYPPNASLVRGTVVSAADDAREVLRAIPDDASDIHLFAHSYGGVVAFELLGALAGRVRSLFLYEPVMFGALANDGRHDPETDPDALREADTMLAQSWFLDDDEKGGTDPWLEMFIDYWNRPGSWSRMPGHLQDYARAAGWKMYQEVRACFYGMQSFDEPVLGDVFTTLAVGERTTKSSRAMTLALARRNPRARLVEVPKVGHMAPLTQPLVVNEPMREHARLCRER
ncbi:MAG: alpha/beta hydrolase [Myxococcales bacterium]|nr:alpha/beta hydrolase [Myxococcales bacterium]